MNCAREEEEESDRLEEKREKMGPLHKVDEQRMIAAGKLYNLRQARGLFQEQNNE